MTERWVAVPGYEGLYEVSDMGAVRSLDRIARHGNGGQKALRGRTIHPHSDTFGYLSVGLWRDGRGRRHRVHRLVLAAFIGPCPPGAVTRHLNGNPADNQLENLCYGSPSENNLDAVKHGTHHQLKKSECKNRHPYTGSNLLVDRHGHRRCRQCTQASVDRRKQRLREAALATTIPDLPGEIWRDIEGFAGAYLVSSYGRVKSLPRHRVPRERIIKPTVATNGYLQVDLGRGENRRTMRLHRLMAESFLREQYFPGAEASHIDGNKMNNRVSNLVWATRSQNHLRKRSAA